MSAAHYNTMTYAQMLEWGAAESAARIADLAGANSELALKAAQDKAKARRKLIGASTGQAAMMVTHANREAKYAARVAASSAGSTT